MVSEQFTAFEWFLLVQHELLLFAAVFFALGVADEIFVDLAYLRLRFSGRARTGRIDEDEWAQRPLAGKAAIFIPAWSEAGVIGPTIAHALRVWPQDRLTLYVGCYRNDADTIASACVAARGDPRIRLVIGPSEGPTSKADCLNRLYTALCEDERRSGEMIRMVVLHDAEDMVDPAALPLLDDALRDMDFVQLPVLALPQADSRWIGSHYSDEFAEGHAKTMVVRSALGGGIPGAGVGCAIDRSMLARLAQAQSGVPFASQSLTEDYELGLRVAALGGRSRFLRARTSAGRLVATRAYFPSDLVLAVRQKTRWMHGISLQGWDRLGWSGSPVQLWMQLRDRRGPFAALLLATAYLLVGLVTIGWIATELGMLTPPPLTPVLKALLLFNIVGFALRGVTRFAFTAREFGLREGLRALPRMIVSNVVTIMAGRRALAAYARTLRGEPVRWDKTEHFDHPALSRLSETRA